MAACNKLAPHRIPKNKCISPRWPMNQRAMHHHDKLEDTWHAANIRWHTHSHVSRVRSLNEQALQCVCGTGKTPTCHSNWWVCGPPAGCPSRVHNARTASTPEPLTSLGGLPKWIDPDLDGEVVQMKPFGSKSAIVLEWCTRALAKWPAGRLATLQAKLALWELARWPTGW